MVPRLRVVAVAAGIAALLAASMTAGTSGGAHGPAHAAAAPVTTSAGVAGTPTTAPTISPSQPDLSSLVGGSSNDTTVGCSDPLTPASIVSQVVPETAADLAAGLTPITAQVVTFNTPVTQITETIPPATWTPLTATASELAYFGFPVKPTSATDLANWVVNWVDGYKPIEMACPCGAAPDDSAEID